MLDKTRGQHLHNRSTSGDTLTDAEQVELNSWYAQQDAEESKLLACAEVSSLTGLREQVDAALMQVEAAAARVRTLAAENDVIRRDIHALNQKLAQTARPSAV